jgi:hypothetical protein
MHTSNIPLIAILIVPFVFVACNKSEPQPSSNPPKPTADVKSAAVVAPAAATTTETAIATSARANASAEAKTLPAGRSTIPTLAEWNSQQKEVTVKGSSALKCETKIVREYLRVSCRGKNDTGGTPTNVAVKKGGHGEALTYVGNGVASLIVPFIEGIDFAADFSWTDKSHTLTAKWPRGSKQPVVVGVFEGAKSPLDASVDAKLAELGCKCHKEVYGFDQCDQLWGVNADCARTYAQNCHDLFACSRGEPSAWPRCQPGYLNGPFGFCHKKCGSNETCGPDETCQGDDGHTICL